MMLLPHTPIRRRGLAVGLAALAFSSWGIASGEEGYDGLSVVVKTEGFVLNPTLTQVTVSNVDPGSPAQAAGIAIGDQIVEVEGMRVVGTKARAIEPHLSKKPGEATNFVLVRKDGNRYSVRLLSVKKPS